MIALFATVALASDLSFNYSPTIEPDQKPWLTVTPGKAAASMQVVVTSEGKPPVKVVKTNLAAGKSVRFEWPRDTGVTSVEVRVLADYADGSQEEMYLALTYSYGVALSVDLSKAQADVAAKTLTVGVSAKVDNVDVVAYGAHKMELDRRTIELNAGPGAITVPWVGHPGDVVLLDVTVHAGGSWAGFTYSPWFLDIPHEDVRFESDQSSILASEEPKLQATLEQLKDVLDKYGDVVPVKLYIAGCTDTVGDGAHNDVLSQARAKAIAGWLRGHGYDKPIFFHGFGERWLAAPTGDGVDEAINRRAAYMVGANPPPTGSGVPSVSWTPL